MEVQIFDKLMEDGSGRRGQRQSATTADDVKQQPLSHIHIINNMPHKHLPYKLARKSKNVGRTYFSTENQGLTDMPSIPQGSVNE